jgi:4'-phosphopantetheinyl transferase
MPIPLNDVPAIAAQLDDQALHVWQLPYRPQQGRSPLRALLGAYLGLPPEALVLREGPHGRPRLDAAQAGTLDFNWSHSGRSALIAIGRHVAPGIDVERRRPRPRALEIARRYFCAAEAEQLAALPAKARDDAFLALWTAKEAVLKALGRGLAFGLHRLEIATESGQPRLMQLDGEEASAWHLRALEVGPECVATLAWRGPPRAVSLWVLACAG